MPAYYRSSVTEFIDDDVDRIVGILTSQSGKTGFSDLKTRAIKAWEKEIDILKNACRTLVDNADAAHWAILLEYPIPRRQKRIDAVLLARDVIFCLEFKTEDSSHTRQAQKQVEDYALDLRDFHEQSRDRRIVPIAVASHAKSIEFSTPDADDDLVRPVMLTNASDLAKTITRSFNEESQPTARPILVSEWDSSPYRPVPTIIEAAEALYAGHDVREITHSHAGKKNVTATSDRVIELIQVAQREQLKIACFVTGVPGAGKTLAGLHIVHNPTLRQEGRPPGVFLSGNGPLVKIIRAAIDRDFKRRVEDGDAERTTSTFIQNVHEFVRVALENPDRPPAENVIVFDEAQRAWNATHNARKTGSELSEPETVLSIMDRHEWAVIVALVGGGQEIHSGEAGLAEWGRSLHVRFPKWRVAASPMALNGDTAVAGQALFEVDHMGSVIRQDPALHLDINVRSFRADRVSDWVDAVMSADAESAELIMTELSDFPLVLTRSLLTARRWLSKKARGLRRCGLVASSGGLRLRAEGLELSSGFRQARGLYVNWFLNDPSDVRSSNQLEVAASEFECQGLELDWVGICWSGDLTLDPSGGNWIPRSFRGNRWKNVSSDVDRQYLINKYRVLLTRAREGMVIWIPQGESTDPTRPREWFDTTAGFLQACGLKVLP